MAKSLGQIHSVNVTKNGIAVGTPITVDMPGVLTDQLNRMVRAGNFFKMVGIDLNLESYPTTSGHGSVSGRIRYYAPTRGRCAAFRGAFKAMADTMALQGLKMRDNKMYDFRVPLNDGIIAFPNNASLNGVDALALNHNIPQQSVFGVHNSNVQPQYTGTAGDLYQGGFSTLVSGGVATDFVLNDTVPFRGNSNVASVDYEEIPFQLSWDGVGTETALNFQWRPDPALYVAVLCGQLEILIDEKTTNDSLTLEAHFMVSGWKSIMGTPDKKTRRKSSKKSSSKRKA